MRGCCLRSSMASNELLDILGLLCLRSLFCAAFQLISWGTSSLGKQPMEDFSFNWWFAGVVCLPPF